MDKKYYVYVYYRENKTPYYIGKGCGSRITAKHGDVIVPKKKYRKKLVENIGEYEAYIIESQLIRKYGRIGLDEDGVLENVELGVCDVDEIEEFYYQKDIFDNREKEFNGYWNDILKQTNGNYEQIVEELYNIKNNSLDQWNRIYLAYCAGYYDNDEEKVEQLEEVLHK
tara:strand:+ start:66 stop:572 length:507 start_codon:yes stop_codon:yes gene_type:complete